MTCTSASREPYYHNIETWENCKLLEVLWATHYYYYPPRQLFRTACGSTRLLISGWFEWSSIVEKREEHEGLNCCRWERINFIEAPYSRAVEECRVFNHILTTSCSWCTYTTYEQLFESVYPRALGTREDLRAFESAWVPEQRTSGERERRTNVVHRKDFLQTI